MKPSHFFKNVSDGLSLAICLTGVAVLIGWVFDIHALKSVLPGFVEMKANTAVCFILIGLSLWASQEKRASLRYAKRLVWFSATIVFLIGLLSFLEYALGYDLGIDQLLFIEPATAILTSSPGRMAVNTAILFILIGSALLMIRSKSAFFHYLSQFIIISSGMIALLSFTGYIYGASPLYLGPGLNYSTAMALHTTILFIMACFAYLFAYPGKALMKTVSSDGFGGLMIRRILPIVVVVPMISGWFKIRSEHTSLFSSHFGVALVTISNLFVTGLFVYVLSVYLNRLDTGRKAIQIDFEKAYHKLKKTQDDLIQSEKESALGRFSAGVAHEVRNPLAVIIGSAEYLQAKLKDKSDDIQANIGRIIKSALRATDILDEILRYAKPSPLKTEKINLNSLVAEVRPLFQIQPYMVKAEVNIELSSEEIWVNVDKNQIHQVIFNLVKNAMEACEKECRINIKTDIFGGSGVIHVIDNGSGMARETLEQVFEPFFTTKKPGYGTGLGLVIAKTIIDNHNGSITVESEEGKGTTVKVFLPLA